MWNRFGFEPTDRASLKNRFGNVQSTYRSYASFSGSERSR